MQLLTKIAKAAFALSLCLTASAYAGAMPVAPNPIKDTTPYSTEDELKVIAFFKFNCPVCRNYHLQLDYWGKSIPKPLSFNFYPVLEGDRKGKAISDESALSSMFFWAVARSGNESQRAAFAESAYELTQDNHQDGNATAWGRAAAESGIEKQRFTKAWDLERAVWDTRVGRQAHYKPTVTPTLVICGKWMISPDSTNGDQNLFIQLASGLVSKCMTEHNIPFDSVSKK